MPAPKKKSARSSEPAKTGKAQAAGTALAAAHVPAERLRDFTESVIREQTRLAHLHGAVNLAQGFPDFPCEPVLKELARQALDADHNQYSVTWGMPALRRAIAGKVGAYNGIRADADRNVTVTCGATEAMICAFLSSLDPGKEVILFQPFYENYHPDAYLSGAKPVYVTLREPDWSIDEKELGRAFNARTAAIVINTPHNPTGKVFTRGELELISELCQKWGARVFSDEIYEHILYDGARHVSPASIPGLEDRTVTIGSASKTYGITGWRVGWAVAHERITNGLRQVHDFMTVCAATPLQEAVRGALGLGPEFYRDLSDHYLRRRDFLVRGLEDAGFHCHVPKGAYYVMADVADFIKGKGPGGLARFRDDADMARHLVSEVKVAAVPGSSFYKIKGRAGTAHKLRFCFCKKEETLALALERLGEFRKRL
ncbi:MAG TPA: aminotransferase class I/II-fold pyridoxal phosphate-dependent enzyme [Fibrobacteria bacterium]|nr:aminotransferase class I/II-fold pyridoxal phosphate-dependent enzyme [Fibrobacteria bacterium]